MVKSANPLNASGRIRLLTIITKLELGGAQQVALNTLRQLPQPDYQLFLVAGRGGLLDSEALALSGVTVQLWRTLRHPIRPFLDLWTLLRLVFLMRRNRIQIVHTHSSKAGLLGRLAAKLAGVPIILHTVHGWPFHPYQPRWLRSLFIILERFSARVSTRLIAVSQATVQKGLSQGIGKPEQYTVVFPGSDLSEFASGDRQNFRIELNLSAGTPLVGMIACLKPQKAPQIFIQAAYEVHQKIPTAHFVLVGDGPERPNVEAEIQRLNMELWIHLTGWRRDVAKIMRGLDLFVLSSLWEGLPCVFAQAQASGLAVVATDVEGAREALLPNQSALLVEPQQPQALALAMIQLLSSPDQRLALGRAGQNFAQQFSVEHMVQTLNELYHQLFAAILKME